MDTNLLVQSFACTCPRCHKGPLYKPGFMNFDIADKCTECGLDYSKADSADGPAVFLIFILGATIVPLAIAMEMTLHPPLWVHAVLWTIVVLGLTLGSLKPLKSYIIALQFKHRRSDWE
jgi:uncharacterized protein (DUF983 family)